MLISEPLLFGVLGFVFVWLAILSVFFYNLARHYHRMTRGITKKDLRQILESLLSGIDKEAKRIDEFIKNLQSLKKDSFYFVQKIGLVRFNPFAETGGDQSFCLAVLDGNDSGFVFSSLHSRENTRIYAKPVKNGKADGYELSAEENQAIKNARKIK